MEKFIAKRQWKRAKASSNVDLSWSPTQSTSTQIISSDSSENTTSSTSSTLLRTTRKRVKGFSKVWKYFKKSQDKKFAKCLTCGKEYKTSGNTSNLKDHLKRFHPNFEKEEIEETEDMDSGILVTNSESTSNSVDVHASCSSSLTSSTRSSGRSINSYFKRTLFYDSYSKKKKDIDKALMWMIAVDFQPFSIVEDVGFKNFVRVLDPKYEIPCKHTIKNNYMHDIYSKGKTMLQSMLNEAKYVAVTCDMWTSRANQGFLAVTCHFINDKFELKTASLSTKKLLDSTNHCSQNIADSLTEVFNQWNILKKITCIVTDNASSMTKACEILRIRHLGCFAHTLNLVVQDSINSEYMKEILTKCKNIVRYFKSSTIAMEKLKQEQQTDKPLSLLQEVPTRWNSVYYMIKRLVQLNDVVCKTLLNIRKSPAPLTADDILILKDFLMLFEHFEDATKNISGNSYVTFSLIIPLTYGIYEHTMIVVTQLQTTEGKEVQKVLLQSIIDRLFSYERRSLPRIATILDPRFKKEGFRVSSNAEEGLKFLEEEMMNSHINSQNTSQLTITQNEAQLNISSQAEISVKKEPLFNFLEYRLREKSKTKTVDVIITKRQYLERQNSSQESDVLLYWKVSGEEFKSLTECVFKFLCIPASSVESERTFSKAGLLISEKRSCLKEKHVDMIIFMNRNKWIFESNDL